MRTTPSPHCGKGILSRWASRGQQSWGWGACPVAKSQHRVKRAQLSHSWHRAGIISIGSTPPRSQQRQRNKLVTIWERGENSIEKMVLIIAQLKFQQSPCCRFWDRLVNLDVIKVWRTLASAFRPLLKIILSAGHQSKPALPPAISRISPPLVQSPHLKTILIHQLTLHHLDYHLYRETQFLCTSHLLTDATCNNKICRCVKPWP